MTVAEHEAKTESPNTKSDEMLAWASYEEIMAAIQAKIKHTASQGTAWLLVHADFAVGFGYANARGVYAYPHANSLLDPRFLQELRLFGMEGEWHVWRRSRKQFCARLRTDANTPAANYIEEHQALWGTRADVGPDFGWTTAGEERGACLCVPHVIAQLNDARRLRLRVRHYLANESKTRLTTICDSRLVALCDADCRPLPWNATE